MTSNFSAPSPITAGSEAEQGADDRLFVRAAARAFQVLAAFQEARGPLSLTEIAALSGLDRSAAQRLVHTLRQMGYLRRSADDRGYLPGLRLLDHTLDFLRLDPLVQTATPVLLELRKTVKERVDLSLFDETRLVYALRMQSKRETFYATLVGHAVPTFCTAGGRAALSVLDDAEAARIIAQSDLTAPGPRTETDPAAILAAVQRARADGFAIVEEEYLPGEIAIGVALSRDGRPIGAIHIGALLSEWTRDGFIDRMRPFAIEAARAIMSAI